MLYSHPKAFLFGGVFVAFLLKSTLSTFSDWGEACSFSDECIDHRFACLPDERDGHMKCFCDQYHEWRGSHLGCYPRYNSTTLIKMLVRITDNTDAREKRTDRIFVEGPLMAGLVVMIVTVGCAISVLIYCMHIRKRDAELKTFVKGLKEENDSRKKKNTQLPSSSERV